ncbi:MAG: hypothetical protein COA79_12490 [Planctomycetota bacterium]|nr:MAG: hypothetical protein COA79_12490 [Planctomycetota bacterium]
MLSDKSEWPLTPIRTSWDDLLNGIESISSWESKRKEIKARFLELIKNESAPECTVALEIKIESEWDFEDYHIQYVSYWVEEDERAHAYMAIPNTNAPEDGFPAVVCLHGTINWGARQTLGLLPEADDPHASNPEIAGKDFARQLVRRGYVTISPEHFCSGARTPKEGSFDTSSFYRKHPNWTAVGKYIYDSYIACSIVAERSDVNDKLIGVTGHSLGGSGSVWLAAFDDRISCVVPSCTAPTFRENPGPLHWSRDSWYVYFPQLRKEFLAGNQVQCDLHEMMALIAPRALLDRFALNDGNGVCQSHRVMLHLKLHDLYKLLNKEQAHSFLVFGDGHSIPEISQKSMLSWLDCWLKRNGNPLDC